MRAITVTAIAMLAAATLQAADVYRSVDENGNVSYSDRPFGQNAEVVFIATRTPGAPPAARNPAPQSANQAGNAADAEETTVQRERREPTPEERAADRAANCVIARERLERYTTSRRLYRELPDGEREYLSDAQIDEARARAAADVDEWCD